MNIPSSGPAEAALAGVQTQRRDALSGVDVGVSSDSYLLLPSDH